ncbi:hypothetical protein ACSBR2_038265 [Camellia fascicularis]
MDPLLFGTISILVPNSSLSSRSLLTEFRCLPPLFEETPNAVHELTLARDIYEHAVVLSVKIEDQDAFERDFFSVETLLYRCTIRIAEFHTELELLSASAMENNCIEHALEQSFMERPYNHVLSARQTVPHETYVYFMDLLAKTVRDEIAECSKKAYNSLSINDAWKILLFSSDKELFEYVKEVKFLLLSSLSLLLLTNGIH